MAIKRGTAGSDTLRGTTGADDLYGLGGNDGLYGLEGNDRLWGGSGVDALFGAAGNDQLYGEAGDDYMLGGLGADYLHGGSGNDRLRGEDGADVLNGSAGDNNILAGAGNDTVIHYGRGIDGNPGGKAFYDGGTGTDTLALDSIGIFPASGDDFPNFLTVSKEADGKGTIEYVSEPFNPGVILPVGEFAGFETFRLQANSDTKLDFWADGPATVFGGKNNDWLAGMDGNQHLTGGAGADDYRFHWRENGGHDFVHGFSEAEGDAILYSEFIEDFSGEIKTTATEKDGHTIYTTHQVETGLLLHTVDVDAIGLPMPGSFFI